MLIVRSWHAEFVVGIGPRARRCAGVCPQRHRRSRDVGLHLAEVAWSGVGKLDPEISDSVGVWLGARGDDPMIASGLVLHKAMFLKITGSEFAKAHAR